MNASNCGTVKEPGCVSAPPKSSRPPGEGSGIYGLGSLLGSVMANTPGGGGGNMPVTDAIFMSGVLLSTPFYVCVVPDTITEEGWIRRNAGNTTRLPAGRLTSLFRPWSCPPNTPCARSPSCSAHVPAPHGPWDRQGVRNPPKSFRLPPERIPQALVVIASLPCQRGWATNFYTRIGQ